MKKPIPQPDRKKFANAIGQAASRVLVFFFGKNELGNIIRLIHPIAPELP